MGMARRHRRRPGQDEAQQLRRGPRQARRHVRHGRDKVFPLQGSQEGRPAIRAAQTARGRLLHLPARLGTGAGDRRQPPRCRDAIPPRPAGPRRGVRGGRVLRRPDSHPPGVRGYDLSRQDMLSGHDEVASGLPSFDRPGQARARADGRRHGAEEGLLPGPRRPGDRRGPSRLPSRRRRGHRARGLPRPRRRLGGRAPRARLLANRHPRGLPLRQLAVPVHGRQRSALRPAGRPRMAGVDGARRRAAASRAAAGP